MTNYPTHGAVAGAASEFDLPPILLFGSSRAALDRATRAVSASGYRIGDSVFIDEGLARLSNQSAASAVWIEIDRDDGVALDDLIERVDGEASDGRYAAIVSTSGNLLDRVDAQIRGRAVDLLIDADEIERTSALAMALSGIQRIQTSVVVDIGNDTSAVQLRRLSDEVGRIAATLATLSKGPAETSKAERRLAPVQSAEPLPDISRDHLRAVIRARRLRSRFFADDLFADPAWDMLLDLMQAQLAQVRVPVSSLCIAAAVPATTALRWLKTLTDRGLIVRRADPFDGRRVFVELSESSSDAIRRYFGEVGQVVGV